MTTEKVIKRLKLLSENKGVQTLDYDEARILLSEIERLNKQLQLISDEFLKYDWENSSKEQIINQLKSLYNSIFKGSDKE